MIEIKDVTITYGKYIAIKNFSARILRNSITAIIGPNGSGKSTLLGAIAGDIEIASGEILINKLSVTELSREELALLRSYAQQSHSYWMAYSVDEILRLGHDEISEERIKYISSSLDIESILKKKVTTLSGGELQRVELARAFMRQSPLVLLDEPFASQDIKSIERIIELMKREMREKGTAFVVVAHSRNEDLTWADQFVEITS
jgi:iron complex transport system ATP-binding protein